MAENTILQVSDPSSPVPQATSDGHLIELWVHGRSRHTQRAYEADARRFMAFVQKPLGSVTLGDLVEFSKTLQSLSTASQYRTLSSVKSLLAFGHRIAQSGTERPKPIFADFALRLGDEGSRVNRTLLA